MTDYLYWFINASGGVMPEVCNVRATRVLLPNGRKTYIVVADDGSTIEPVATYLAYLHGNNNSPNTVEAYARHLAFLFRWLAIRRLDWESLDLKALSMFASDLKDGTLPSLHRVGTYRPREPRSRSTCEAVLAAIYSFLQYWKESGRGPQDLNLYRESNFSYHAKHSFLAHAESKTPPLQRAIKVRGPKADVPDIIGFEDDFGRLLQAANTERDRALLSAMYDGGLRIGQALGLHHEDLDFARRRITVTRRENNPNEALSKQRNEFWINMPARFFTLYDKALSEQMAYDIDSDFVFVNIALRDRGAPMTPENGWGVVKRIGERCGLDLHPHTLRHTHGTALAKDGWSAPQIAKRLGQVSASSADVYIHLAEDDIQGKYLNSNLARAEA